VNTAVSTSCLERLPRRRGVAASPSGDSGDKGKNRLDFESNHFFLFPRRAVLFQISSVAKIKAMNTRKILIALFFIAVGIIVTSVFWKQPILLSLILIMTAFIKEKLAPIKKGFLVFVVIGLLGAATESLIIWLGNEPWAYKEPFLINTPLWLLPLWGLAGTVFITLYEGILK